MSEDCPHCEGRDLPAGSRFCPFCGTQLASYTPEHLREEVLTKHDTLRGERKEVTVLFADVAGSLAMAAALDPEDVHAIMDGFFAFSLEAVHAERGTINQFRGDGFMALFGAPHAKGEDAARALRAALEIRSRAESYSESVRARFGIPLTLRMGVNTGHVWVGSIGGGLRKDYTAEGPAVGLAARLQEAASPGQILVGEEAVRRCGGYFELADRGKRRVRGIPEEVRVFELLAAGPYKARIGLERARGLTPFAGRARELRQLARAAEPLEGIRTVEVRGEAGIGKSRLVLEYLERRPAGVFTLEAQCREPHAERAYVPFLELLRGWPPNLPRPAEIDALIAHLEGRRPSGGSAACDPRVAVRRILGEATSRSPLILHLEDVQWLDPSSRAVIRGLVENPPSGSLVILATRRIQGDPDWGAGASVERIQLGPLVDAEARALAGAILGDLENAEALAELAALRGGGNPLFVEEVARALRESSQRVRQAAEMEISLRHAAARIPDTLHGVVAARIDALPEASKRALEAAAVIGQDLDGEILGEIDPALDTDPVSALNDLAERGLLQWRPEGLLDFRHGVVRDVAYQQLLRERRRELHGRVAEAMSTRPAATTPDGASRIGTHYDQAGNPAAAIPFLARAGRAYAGLDAPAEAAAHLRRALELSRTSPRPDVSFEIEIGTLLARALNTLDRSGEAAEVLEAIESASAGSEDRLRLATASIEGGWARFSAGNDLHRGRRLIERGLSLAEGLPEAYRTIMLGHSYLARILTLDGAVDEATRHIREINELAAGQADRAGLIIAFYNESLLLCDAGRVDAARSSALEALGLARESETPLLLAFAEIAMAKVHVFAGEPDQALAAAERGAELGKREGQVGIRFHAACWRGYAHLLAGEPRLARDAFERLAEINDTWPSTFLYRARGQLEVGAIDRAAELARECLERAPGRMIRARALAVLGLAIGLGDPDRGSEAEERICEAISLAGELGLLPYLAEARQFLAELLQRRGDRERAAYYAERAAEGFESCGMPAHADDARRLCET